MIAPADNLDCALFAFPIFEGEVASKVFQYYQYLYFPDAARVEMRANNMDHPQDIGLVHADVYVGDDHFKVSTIHPNKALWPGVVAKWEDQWVFDHLVATTGEMPSPDRRVFKGGREIQQQVANTYSEFMRKYTTILSVGLAALIVFASMRSDTRD
ncbi:hypothetical protein D3C75_1051310 [compost metagenome]